MSAKWPIMSLGEIFAIARGGSPRPIDQFLTEEPNGVNWVLISDASDSSKYINSTKKRILQSGVAKSRLVGPGDFLLTNSMSFGRPYIMNTTGCIHDGWLVLSDQMGLVNRDYFYHLLGSDSVYAEFARLAPGATVKNLNIDLVQGVRVPVPPLPEQKRIAAILDAADALRAKRCAALALLDTMAQSIFLEMFGDPVTNPKGWQLRKVSDFVAQFQGGKSLEAESDENVVTTNRILKISAVTTMRFNDSESKPVPDGYHPPTEHFVRRGDLLFSRANTTELVGAVAYVDKDPTNLLMPDKLWRFVWPTPALTHPLFIWSLFQSSAIRHEIGRRATGTSGSMKNISQEKLFGITTILPPLPLQQKFAARITALETLKSTHRKSLAELDALFTSLQHRAFRGEL